MIRQSIMLNLYGPLFLLIYLTLTVSYAFGQAATTSAIQGTVTDATGAFVPGAEVTVTLVSTGRALTVTTNPEGFYSADGLSTGLYDVSIKKAGFKIATTQALNLDAGLRLGHNVTLQVGEITEQVNVTAEALRVQTESGESAGVISGEEAQGSGRQRHFRI